TMNRTTGPMKGKALSQPGLAGARVALAEGGVQGLAGAAGAAVAGARAAGAGSLAWAVAASMDQPLYSMVSTISRLLKIPFSENRSKNFWKCATSAGLNSSNMV